MDLANTAPDVRIVGDVGSFIGFAFARGDFKGDKIDGLFLGGKEKSYFLFGNPTIVRGTTLDMAVSTSPRIPLSLDYNTSFAPQVVDIDRNGKDDLLIPGFNLDIVFGKDPFPAWPVADIHVSNGVGRSLTTALQCPAAGDLAGDGKTELIIANSAYAYTPFAAIINGADLFSGPSAFNVDPSSPDPFPTTPLPLVVRNPFGSVIGDFDGDGKNDLFIVGNSTGNYSQTTPYLNVYLSSQYADGMIPLNSLQNPTFVWDRPFECIKLVDVNGDGLKDLVAYDNVGSLPPYGAIRIMYGFRLLLNPTVTIEANPSNTSRVKLTLSVKGDPAEMKISGDIVDSFKDQWIPYRTNPEVTLTSAEESKKIRVRFRNAYHRESETAEATTALSVDRPQVSVLTNRVTAGGRARINCSLTETGRIKATVYNRLGEKVKVLMDEERGPGVWPVEWDGRNSEGNFVVSGYYILITDVAGQELKTTLLVQ